jgi:hypothetical protein
MAKSEKSWNADVTLCVETTRGAEMLPMRAQAEQNPCVEKGDQLEWSSEEHYPTISLKN